MARLPWKYAAALALLAPTACDMLPRDTEGTSARVEEARSFRVAVADPSLRSSPQITALLREIEKRTKARPHWQQGSGEALFQQLDEGALDLVIGRFTADSPWATKVSFAPALSATGSKDARIELKAAMRNGENRWIMTVERASRAVSLEGRSQ